MIVEVLGDDDVEHRHAQGRVGARTQLQVIDRTRGEPIGARINRDELAAALHDIDDGMAEETVAVGGKRLLAPGNHDLGDLVHRVVIASGQAAGIVHLGVGHAGDIGASGNARDVAGVTGLRIAGIGRADHGRAVGTAHRAALATGATEDDDGLGAVLLLEALDVLLDDVIGLIPGDALPLVLAAVLLGAFHRVDDAIGMIGKVGERKAAHAKASLRNGLVFVAFDLLEDAVLVHVELDAASNGMAARRRPGAGARDGIAVLLVTPGLAQVVFEVLDTAIDFCCRGHVSFPSSLFL